MVLLIYTIIPLLGAIFFILLPKKYWQVWIIKDLGIIWASYSFIVSLTHWLNFDVLTTKYQWNYCGLELAPKIGLVLSTGLDGLSLFFLILTGFIILLCMLSIKMGAYSRYYVSLILVIQALLNTAFCTTNLLVFYIAFESVLTPMFLMIGIWGSSSSRRIKAAFFLFLYTFVCSTLALLGIFDLFYEVGSLEFFVLSNANFCIKKQLYLWFVFFLAFAVKIPMFPMHIWLPEAHVQAPTEGSVILAALLLKLGGYGFIRISLPLFPYGSIYFSPLIHLLCIVGIVYASLTTIIQIDLKKIIAYSSIAHMNLVVLGIFSFNNYGLQGSLFLMLSHGIVSSGLFFMVGFLYDRHQTRILNYFGGLATFMPIYSTLFFIFVLANMSMPGTANFIGEFLTFAGVFKYNMGVACVAAISIVLCAAYSIWMYNRMIFGNIKSNYLKQKQFEDLLQIEFTVLFPLAIAAIVLGIFPDIILNYTYFSIEGILQLFYIN